MMQILRPAKVAFAATSSVLRSRVRGSLSAGRSAPCALLLGSCGRRSRPTKVCGVLYMSSSTEIYQEDAHGPRMDEDDSINESDSMGVASTTLSQPFATEYHAPVMWQECIDALLDCERGRGRSNSQKYQGESLIFVDATLGGGGHSAALLERLRPGDLVLGCDVDPNALATASERLQKYMQNDQNLPLFVPVQSNFGSLTVALADTKHPITQESILSSQVKAISHGPLDGILMDLGVSSHQIDTPERGFAFMKDGPLDMRMDSKGGLTAADVCNEFDASELQRIFRTYGDEPRAKAIAGAIVQYRPMHTTQQLVEAISTVVPQFAKKGKRRGRTATLARIFQSLRIVVNDEDGVLSRALTQTCPALLRYGGRLVVLSYHSMEDRATKRIMRDGTLGRVQSNDSRDIYGNYNGPAKPFHPVGKRRAATEQEVELNPRARSATLRVAERI